MSTHTNHGILGQSYFVTITCHKWLSLFEITDGYGMVYSWFNHLKKDSCHVLAYVIMPNHVHCLLYPTQPNKSLNKLVGEGKRFIAYGIVKKLNQFDRDDTLKILVSDVDANERAKGKKHQVFRPSFDAKLCTSKKMEEQKIDYIHHNPVSGKWMLVDDFAKYEHSSVKLK